MVRQVLRSVVVASFLSCCAFSQVAASGDTQVPPDRINRITGFDQSRVTRHYFLLKNGGAVEVTAKDENDKATVQAIQNYLKKEAESWTKGNFETVTQIYGRAPEGTPVMKKLRDDITFAAVAEPNGAILRILTINTQAKSAIYDYLRFQIAAHKTGDPTTPEE